jgi:hypothetical protein
MNFLMVRGWLTPALPKKRPICLESLLLKKLLCSFLTRPGVGFQNLLQAGLGYDSVALHYAGN